MRKNILATSLIALGLTLEALPALAEEVPAPLLTPPEQTAVCLFASALGIVASVVERQGCPISVGDYDVTMAAKDDGQGSIQLDGVTLSAKIELDSETTVCRVVSKGAGKIDHNRVTQYQGLYRFETNGTVLKGGSELEVEGAAFKQSLAHKFWQSAAAVPNWGSGGSVILSAGEDDITKPKPPESKWSHTVKLLRPDPGDGRVRIEKVQAEAADGVLCKMAFSALSDDFGGGYQTLNGKLDVMKN